MYFSGSGPFLLFVPRMETPNALDLRKLKNRTNRANDTFGVVAIGLNPSPPFRPNGAASVGYMIEKYEGKGPYTRKSQGLYPAVYLLKQAPLVSE